MAQITIHKDLDVEIVIVDGPAPVDQSAQVSSLQAQVNSLQLALSQANADKAALQSKINNARAAAQADKDADNANVAGQGVLDALA